MKITPINRALIVLAVLLGAVELFRGGGGAPSREIGRLFPQLFMDQASRIELVGPDGEVRLSRGEEGWLCTDKFGHPASERTTATLLRALASLTTMDLLSEDPERLGSYGLDLDTTRVRVWNEDGDVVADMVQGRNAPDSRASYVRRFGDDAVYRAPQLRRIPCASIFWFDPAWMPFEPAIVKSIRIETSEAAEAKVLEREERRYRWFEGTREVAATRVDDFLQALLSLGLQDVVADPSDSDALGEVVLRVELTLLDDRVLIGEFAAPGDGSVRARRVPDGWVVTLTADSVVPVRQRASQL